jgi:high-affinity iron transporter
MRRPRRILLLAVAALVLGAAPASAASEKPWQAADGVNDGLFHAQTELIIGTAQTARADVEHAREAYADSLAESIESANPAADRDARAALAEARRAVAGGDQPGLAAARGKVRAAIFRGAYSVTLGAVDVSDVRTARDWLLLREFRTATRFTRPGADATLAVDQLGRRTLSPRDAHASVQKDLLDAYQARLRELLDDAARGQDRKLPVRRAEAAAQAQGYFELLTPRYREDRGAGAADAATAAYAQLARAALGSDDAAFTAARDQAARALDGFTAAPFTDEEAARRAQQLLRFVALVPTEYGRGVKGGEVRKDFEIQEGVAFRDGAESAFDDLQDTLAKRDPASTAAARRSLDQLKVYLDRATKTPKDVASTDEVKAAATAAQDSLKKAMPSSWQEKTDESDYDLIALTLDRMEAAVGAGQYKQAEQTRLEAYAFFEFGPERRLKAFNQGLALEIEGLIWFGSGGDEGLATLISKRAPRREIRETRVALDEKLADAAATLGDSSSKTTVVVNSAVIVFREGLEAVLILAAITASFVGARRHLRRPVLIGAIGGLLASVVTWVLAQTLLTSLEQYGEKLEAVVGLIAIGVLLLITNWFFHKVYWSEWIGKFHRRRKSLEKLEKRGFISAQVLGLAILGLTSVYREGFETVLFLQSLELSAGTVTVLEGAGLGLAMTLGVAVLTFALQRKLPYKRMLIITGVLIGFVLVVMVGQTARTMQGTGWLSITSTDVIDPPYWMQLWFGVYPTVETIGAQIAAAVFVIGSYFLAQEVRVKRPKRRLRRERAATAEAAPVTVNGNGRHSESELIER